VKTVLSHLDGKVLGRLL